MNETTTTPTNTALLPIFGQRRRDPDAKWVAAGLCVKTHVLVDAALYDKLCAYNWYQDAAGITYSSALEPDGSNHRTRLSRFILELSGVNLEAPKQKIIHLNGDITDLRRSNLRLKPLTKEAVAYRIRHNLPLNSTDRQPVKTRLKCLEDPNSLTDTAPRENCTTLDGVDQPTATTGCEATQ